MTITALTSRELNQDTVLVLLIEQKDARKGSTLRTWMDQHVLSAFGERIIPVDIAAALRGAGLHIPEPRPVRDALIAATAISGCSAAPTTQDSPVKRRPCNAVLSQIRRRIRDGLHSPRLLNQRSARVSVCESLR